jgi:GH24 family phage-related lysozyme (muramidase)
MPLQSVRLFDPDPMKVRSMKGLDLVTAFNDSLIPFANGLEPAPSPLDDPVVDLDGEDALARQRREQATQSDIEYLALKRQEDDAFLARRDARSQDSVDTSNSESSYATTSGGEELPYDGPKDFVGMVKEFEGFSGKAFGDYKQTSIGYGTKARKGETSISKEEADRRLESELAMHRKRVLDHAQTHGYKFSENQINALTSFDFNTGRLEALTGNGSRPPEVIADRITRYNKAGGKVLPGLVKRRKAELALFTQP